MDSGNPRIQGERTLFPGLSTRWSLIPIYKPVLGEEESQAARRVILSGWVTQGPETAAFEKEFAAFVGSAFACAVSSCTTALYLALKAVGAGPGDRVITVSHSFIATANAIRHCGAEPVFVDILPGVYNIDPDRIEPAVDSRTKAVLVVHQIGMPCDLEAVLKVTDRLGLPLVEDAACAVGSEIELNGEWQRIGRPHGKVAAFSLHPRKLLTTGEGGMLTTNDPGIDKTLRQWRQHCMSVPDTVRHGSNQVIFEEYPEVGYNFRLSDIAAAVGRVQLSRIPGLLARRVRQVSRYVSLLGALPEVGLPEEPSWARTNWQSFTVRLPDGLDQRKVMQSMLEAGVATRRGILNSHLEKPYLNAKRVGSLAQSEAAQDRCIILPLFDAMTEEDQDRVVESLTRAIRAKV